MRLERLADFFRSSAVLRCTILLSADICLDGETTIRYGTIRYAAQFMATDTALRIGL